MISNRASLALVCIALLASWCVGMFGRGYWTPDEPREADIAWRMSSQADPAVPVLAGEAFCEKPPLTYWLAGASIRAFGTAGWAARIPNLGYAIVTTLCVAWLARRLAGALAATVAAAASATFLLSYQVAIWLATDAPELAAVALALAAAYAGFYAQGRRGRLLGYGILHLALALGFLAKSAAAWIVPVLTLATLIVWERRWRELLRWELWIGVALQVLIIGAWIWSVYVGPQGAEHLRVFLWNNLIGRFVHINAPAGLQYTMGHQNFPGKYLLEMPIYLFPWTLLLIAAAVRAWQARADLAHGNLRILRWAFAASLPALVLLSVAATARNVYVAPLLPGAALLLAWWVREAIGAPAKSDMFALRGTAILLWLATFVAAMAVLLAGFDAGEIAGAPAPIVATLITLVGAAACAVLSGIAWRLARGPQLHTALLALLLAYCSLLLGPASQVFHYADRWQDLAAMGHDLKADLAGAPLILIGADETTRAWVDEYVRTEVTRAPAPEGEADAARLTEWMKSGRQYRALMQLEGRALTPRLQALAVAFGIKRPGDAQSAPPAWIGTAHLAIVSRYTLPNGRRYALLALAP